MHQLSFLLREQTRTYDANLLAGQIFQGLLKKACDAELTVMTTLLINAKKMQYILAANRLMK